MLVRGFRLFGLKVPGLFSCEGFRLLGFWCVGVLEGLGCWNRNFTLRPGIRVSMDLHSWVVVRGICFFKLP